MYLIQIQGLKTQVKRSLAKRILTQVQTQARKTLIQVIRARKSLIRAPIQVLTQANLALIQVSQARKSQQ